MTARQVFILGVLLALVAGCGGPSPSVSASPSGEPSPTPPFAGVPLDCDGVPLSDCRQALAAAVIGAGDFKAEDVVHGTLRRQDLPDVPVESFVMILTLRNGRVANVAMMREIAGGPIVVGMFEPTPEPLGTLDPAVCATRQHQAPDLEAQLPTEIASDRTCRFSIRLPDDPGFLAQLAQGQPGLQAILDTVPGSNPSDLSLAFAQTGDPERSVDAIRLDGGDGDAMLKAMLPFDPGPVSWTTIAGRSVAIVGPDPTMDIGGLPPHHYVAGRAVVYVVSGFPTDSPVLSGLIAGLPWLQ